MISKIGLTVQLKGLPRQMEKVPCFDMYFIRVVSLKSRSGQNLLVKCKRGIALFWLNLWLLMTTSQTFPFQTKVCLFPPPPKKKNCNTSYHFCGISLSDNVKPKASMWVNTNWVTWVSWTLQLPSFWNWNGQILLAAKNILLGKTFLSTQVWQRGVIHCNPTPAL